MAMDGSYNQNEHQDEIDLPADVALRVGDQLDQFLRDQEGGIQDKTIGDYLAAAQLTDPTHISVARTVFEMTKLGLGERVK